MGSWEGGPPTWGSVSPSMFPYLKRTHKYKEPPSPTNSSFYGNVREHIRIGGSWPRVGITD